ncbi:WD40 repeat domain-containing protein [Ruegeria lacuscaerulensis]|uniref:WD40 repeat domain-containing protein n=1 Tax=Ruegeria lacuscaerulensis TaxID=55218 RepID=UPI001480DB32|nr:WD40 repeat domain-containing protein [Ruegeria lacuscaerulensis]
MAENSASGLSLFSLLAREWTLNGEVTQIAFNNDDTAAIFIHSAGKVALASTKDAESPKVRTRLELDTGRTTIRPRENPVAPLLTPDIAVRTDLPVVRFGTQGFAAIDMDGAVQQITAGGQIVRKLQPQPKPVTAISASQLGDLLAIARGNVLELVDPAEMVVQAEFKLDHPISCLTVAADGRTTAAWGAGALSIVPLTAPNDTPTVISCPGDITGLVWQKSGHHLVCASAENRFYIIDIAQRSVQCVEGYPNPVRDVAFSEAGNALVTSGAYRLAGWDMSDLPVDDKPGTPLTTGKPGFVVLNSIAAHPERNIVATGYASGLVTLARIGTSQDMMLHHERDTSVNSLSWSKTGEHLAIGFASGKAAMVTFPAQMFK